MSPAVSLADLPAVLPPGISADGQADEVFDRYAHLIRTTLGVPVGLISLVSADGQVFPGAEGLPDPWQQTRGTGLSHSFCQHVVAHDAPLVITDARRDPALAENLAIDDLGVIAYAGFPLHDPDGVPVGSLCAIDTEPRDWSERELEVLADLARTASRELTLRRALVQVHATQDVERAAAAHVSQVSDAMAIGYLVMDADWRITYVNTEGRRVLGAAGDELVGQILWELFPATVGTLYETNYRRAVASGQVVAFDAYYPAPLDTWFEIRATPQGGGLALYFLDITARRDSEAAAARAAAQVSALGQVATALAEAVTLEDLVAVMAEQGLAAVGADGGSVAVPDPDQEGQLLSYITANFGAGTRADFSRLPLSAQLPVTQAARTGQPVLLADAAACAAMSPHVLEANAATGCQAWASIPLRAGARTAGGGRGAQPRAGGGAGQDFAQGAGQDVAQGGEQGRGQVLGVLTAGWREPQTFLAEQIAVLESFAAQCAQALLRLRAHEAEARALAASAGIAETLQRAMLTPPPEPDHLQIAVRYGAAGAHAEVGGDWYDAFITSEGVTTLVIGDVSGHDMRAAAVMGQLRNLLRGITFTLTGPPARLLSALDRVTTALGVEAGATVIVAQVEQDGAHRAAGTRLLRWSNAGHLPPLLIEADGSTRFLQTRSDLLLGWDPDTDRHDHEVVLQPGATVLLYTDGLIERRGSDLQEGLAWLARTAADLATGSVTVPQTTTNRPRTDQAPTHQTPTDQTPLATGVTATAGVTLEELCDGLLAAVDGQLDDDVALLALRAHPEDGPRPPEAGPERVPDGLAEVQNLLEL